MNIRVINQEQVRRLLPMDECIDLMAEALRTLSRDDAVQPLRTATWLPNRCGLIGLMPGYLGEPPVLGVKALAVFPGNHGTVYDSHQGAILLFDVEHGQLEVIIDATEVTAIRTAAVSAVATQSLANENAAKLTILGTGTQARTHLEAIPLVRDLDIVRVWSRNHDAARRFAKCESTHHNMKIEPVRTARDAVDTADIICTVTAATEPILCGDWISPGAHINAVGACIARARELDTQTVVHARLFVDRRESTFNESGDFLIPKAEGVINDDHILGELGEVLLDRASGRISPQDITLFKSLGLAVEDLAAAHHIFNAAKSSGVGTMVKLGGRRNEPA